MAMVDISGLETIVGEAASFSDLSRVGLESPWSLGGRADASLGARFSAARSRSERGRRWSPAASAGLGSCWVRPVSGPPPVQCLASRGEELASRPVTLWVPRMGLVMALW
jgi:hypothetical protein